MAKVDDIFFVYLLNSVVEKVVVFGHVNDTDELFSEIQQEYFESEKVEIVVSERRIYKEESVASIRYKICQELGEKDVYLFTETVVDPVPAWSAMFNDGHALQHMIEFGVSDGVKETHAQWMQLLLGSSQTKILTPLGFYSKHGTLANPFSVIDDMGGVVFEDAMHEPFLRFSRNCTDQSEFCKTSANIYACLKKPVIEYGRINHLNLSGYFPHKITPKKLDKFDELRAEVREFSGRALTATRYLEDVVCTWNIGQDGLPLEAIFKRFHATDEFPSLTWTRPTGEPLIRFLKSRGAPAQQAQKKNAIHFVSSQPDQVWSLYAEGRFVLTMNRADSAEKCNHVNTRLIQEVNVILHTLSLNLIRVPVDVMSSCSFKYTTTTPIKKLLPGPCLNYLRQQFGVEHTGTLLRLKKVDCLDYIPILDKYLDYLLLDGSSSTTTTMPSFWIQEDEEVDDDDDDDKEEEEKKGPRLFQRPLKKGYEILQPPRYSGGGGSVSGWRETLLGGQAWQPAADYNGQTFLEAMAFLYAREVKSEEEDDFCEILISSLTLDRFIKYHNGNLPALYRSTKEENDDEDVKDSTFAKSLQMDDPYQADLLHEVVGSYKNFINKIRQDKNMDYTHLWDVVCDVNPKLFPRGLNLVMIQDGHFICPTNAYSAMNRLDPEKATCLVLVTPGNQYVPLQSPEGQVTVRTSSLPKQVAALLQQCRPQPSLSPDQYTFRPSISSAEIAKAAGIVVVDQVVQNEKAIALRVRGLDASQQPLYLPCLPSAILDQVSTTTVEQAQAHLLPYAVTRDRLSGLAYASHNQIPCKPRYKVVQGGTYRGIVTEANEFVPTLQSGLMSESDDDLETLATTKVASTTTTTTTTDEANAVALRLEGQFYDLYRGVIRMLLQEETRQEWLRQIQSVTVSYENKLKYLQSEIQKLIKDRVHFQMMDAQLMKDVHDMVACDDDSTGAEEPYCLTLENGGIKTIFPKFNLVDPTVNNETLYAMRMADEMIRVRRIPSAANTGTEYNLNDDEIVLQQSQVAAYKSADERTVWDTAQPQRSTDAGDAAKFVQDCIQQPARRIRHSWNTVLGKKAVEVVFKKTCALAPLMYLAQLHGQSQAPMSESEVRRVLWKAYETLLRDEKHRGVLLELLGTQTPDLLQDRVLRSTEYRLSDVDWWAFCQNWHVPAFLVWGDPASTNWIRLYTETSDNTAYWFIRKEKPGQYTLVSTAFAMSALNLAPLKDDQGRLLLQEI
jgi:hypothetical protein